MFQNKSKVCIPITELSLSTVGDTILVTLKGDEEVWIICLSFKTLVGSSKTKKKNNIVKYCISILPCFETYQTLKWTLPMFDL